MTPGIVEGALASTLGRVGTQGIQALLGRLSTKRAASPTEVFCDRFLRLFSAQGVVPVQIPRVLGSDCCLMPGDFLEHDRLIEGLDEPTLARACELSGVQRGWLDGVEAQVYEPIRVYKHLEEAIDLFQRLTQGSQWLSLHVVKATSNELDNTPNASPVVVCLRELVTHPDGVPFHREYLLDRQWNWTHRRSRLVLKALCCIAWQFSVYPTCVSVPPKHIDRFVGGDVLFGELLDESVGESWHLDDYIFTEDESACAADPDEALAVRLHLSDSGLMKRLLDASGYTRLRSPRQG